MTMQTPVAAKYRKDYRPTDFLIQTTDLIFRLFEDHALVESRLLLRRNPKGDLKASRLILDGSQLELERVELNGQLLADTDYQVTDSSLTLLNLGRFSSANGDFELTTQCKVYPKNNASLEGLYQSNGKFCTQCEAEGFRKITYYLDRPDVLSLFSVRIEANRAAYPYLLSNGNPTQQGDLANGRHFAEWEDPFLKPSYLFALVAGNLDLLEDTFVTQSGREVKLQLFVDKGKLDQSDFALESLKNAMRWDEQRFNFEYDLDLYMIVAVGDFNMGAMENKGLNIFNTKYVLANKSTATDMDFEHIESVIGHEYFHNWTGNRITCRDWFQLSLKEGLTVFRDQVFTEDMRSQAVKRIDDVKVMRSYQFAEDAGPMAHPIRPDSYIEMNNFYTVTVYNKGAEVIRMLHTLLGEKGFQKGMQCYVERHDGQAVTCADFVSAMQDANDCDLADFGYWYSQAGTPEVAVSYAYDKEKQVLALTLSQSNPNSESIHPYQIPVKMGLLSTNGEALSFSLAAAKDSSTNDKSLDNLVDNALLDFRKSEQTFYFNQVVEAPIVSLFRDFSAPVKWHCEMSNQALAVLFAHDPNSFNRWDAGQQLLLKAIAEDDAEVMSLVEESFAAIIHDDTIDNAFKARALSLPDLKTLFEAYHTLGVDTLIERHRALVKRMAVNLSRDWLSLYRENHEVGNESLSQAAIANRSVKNLALSYLAKLGNDHESLVVEQFNTAKTMTDEQSALVASVHGEVNCANTLTQEFYQKWRDEALVMDKWISIQVTKDTETIFDDIDQLRQSDVFNLKNPNKVRSLYGSFAGGNFAQFHNENGKGYQLIVDAIGIIDPLNPQVAASLAKQFASAIKLDQHRRELINQQLTRLTAGSQLSPDVTEVVSKTLQQLNQP